MVRYTIKKTLLAEVNVQRLDIVFRTGISRCLIDMSLHICRNSIQCNRPQYIVGSNGIFISNRRFHPFVIEIRYIHNVVVEEVFLGEIIHTVGTSLIVRLAGFSIDKCDTGQLRLTRFFVLQFAGTFVQNRTDSHLFSIKFIGSRSAAYLVHVIGSFLEAGCITLPNVCLST